MLDLQKAGIFKRFSAWLCDVVLLAVVAIGAILLGLIITNYDSHTENYISLQAECGEMLKAYAEKYGEDIINSTEEERATFTPEQKALYEAADAELKADPKANELYGKVAYEEQIMYNLILTIVPVGLLIAFLILEFLVPLLFKNGQTVGKKIFGIGVMKNNGTRLTPQILFVRAILGKYTMETMVPVFLLLLVYAGFLGGLVGIIVVALIGIFNIVLMIATKANLAIHDALSYTVTVELASQRIFENEQELLEYKQKLHAEAAERAAY